MPYDPNERPVQGGPIDPRHLGLLSMALPSPVGDVVGLLADGMGYARNPSSLTPGAGLLSLAGLIPGVPAPSLIGRIRKLNTGSEPAALLFTKDVDAAASLADNVGGDVSTGDLAAAREWLLSRTKEKWGGRKVTVYRGGPVRGDVVPVTTDIGVAKRFAKGGKVFQKEIDGDMVLADMEVLNGPLGGFAESELLVPADIFK